jgi:serine/threonine protein kinase/WD40 repeat protein
MSGIRPLEPGDPVQVGAYRLLGRLGAGGMGQVFLGISRGGRKVAVKVLRGDLLTDPEFHTRFAREVAAARTVNGFYTAPVVDADPNATPPWMVTAYVQGPSLAAAVAQRGPLSEPEVRGLAAALAEGLASIHAGGLVHRDLKPANIILATDGPRIIDFGIARAVGASTMTAQGTIIGTFTYMSPEQVMGFAAGPQSDVFSLGSVLVFAATGHGPFEADSLPAITHRILSEPPDLAGLPEALHDLVRGCLTKDRGKRLSLDDLLTRLAASDTLPVLPDPGHPDTILAPPVPLSAPAPAAQPAAGPAYAPVATPAPASALATQGMPPAVGTQTLRPPAMAHQGYGPLSNPPTPGNPPLDCAFLDTSGWPVTEIAFSPDGRLLAGASCLSGSWRVFLWDVSAKQLVAAPVDGRNGTAPKLAFSPDGQLLVLKEPGATRLLRLATSELACLHAGAPEYSWRRVRFSPDGRLLATVGEQRRASGFAASQVRLWHCATLQPAGGPFKVGYADDSTFAFSPDSRYLFSGHEGEGFLGDITLQGSSLRKLKGVRGTAGRAAFSADARLLAVQSTEGDTLTLFDTAEQAPVTTLACGREIRRVEFSLAAPLLATALVSGGSESIEFWYLTPATAAQSWPTPFTGQYTTSRAGLTGFPVTATELRFSPDGAFLAAASRAASRTKQAFVRTWATGSAQPGVPLDLPGPVRMTFAPDSRFLAAVGQDAAVRLVSLGQASQPMMLPGSTAAFSPSSQLLATTHPAGVRLWTLPQ